MWDMYWSPPGFCFDTACTDPALVTNKNSPEFNVYERVQKMVDYLSNQVLMRLLVLNHAERWDAPGSGVRGRVSSLFLVREGTYTLLQEGIISLQLIKRGLIPVFVRLSPKQYFE